MPSLNLTPARGPSVWTKIDRRFSLEPWQVAAVAGTVLAAIGVWPRSRRGSLAILGVGAAISLFAGNLSGGIPAVRRVLRFPPSLGDSMSLDEAVDQASEGSFPASDPPALMPD